MMGVATSKARCGSERLHSTWRLRGVLSPWSGAEMMIAILLVLLEGSTGVQYHTCNLAFLGISLEINAIVHNANSSRAGNCAI